MDRRILERGSAWRMRLSVGSKRIAGSVGWWTIVGSVGWWTDSGYQSNRGTTVPTSPTIAVLNQSRPRGSFPQPDRPTIPGPLINIHLLTSMQQPPRKPIFFLLADAFQSPSPSTSDRDDSPCPNSCHGLSSSK